LSFLVPLLPFLDETGRWASIQSTLERTYDPYELDIYGDLANPYDGMSGEDPERNGRDEEAAKEPPWVAGGPEPWQRRYPPWAGAMERCRCPSDPGIGPPGIGRTNYAACLGDGVVGSDSGPFRLVNGRWVPDAELAAEVGAAMRGVFVPRMVTRLDDIQDGLAHTLMVAEIATDLDDRDVRTRPAAGPGPAVLRDHPCWALDEGLIDADRPQFWLAATTKLQSTPGWGRGLRWADGMPLYTAVNTILPPNREITLHSDRDDCWGILPPSSRHQGMVNACFADGSVRVISDSIDSGDARQPTVYLGSVHPPDSESPFGLWGAMGTRSSGELKW
jgi:prepilin-type processing-associated H-X9-DG protein